MHVSQRSVFAGAIEFFAFVVGESILDGDETVLGDVHG